MHSPGELPQRTAFVGPYRPVLCDVPGEVIAQFRDALNELDTTTDPISSPAPTEEIARAHHTLAAWATPERPGGGVDACPPPPGAPTAFFVRDRS